jgi:hypothetical protein
MPLYTSKALRLKSIDYAQGLLFAYLYLAATSIKRPQSRSLRVAA